MNKLKNTSLILLVIVITAFGSRVVLIWIGRAEFVGWFNHTYYYYVQTKGLLSNGQLPFPDMPLLFYLYGLTAKAINTLGTELNDAIIHSTRFWMSLLPAILPVPVYWIINNIHKGQPLQKRDWLLVLISAFLPLTLVHQPEYAQKNVAGLLLLTILLLAHKKALNDISIKSLVLVFILAAIIVLTHFGTAAAMILYGIAIMATVILFQKRSKQTILLSLAGVCFALAALFTIHLIDSDRTGRILTYCHTSFDHSFVGDLLSTDTSTGEKALAFAGIIIPVLALLFLSHEYKKAHTFLDLPDRIFWRVNIIFCYLLVLPVYDQLLLARLVQFAYIPLLINLAYLLKYANWKAWIKNTGIGLLFIMTVLMAVGEVISQTIQSRYHEEIYQDLLKIKQQVSFQPNDLILTKNGTEHICNWFLGTKAGLITALHLDDFRTYGHIYILNPVEGELSFDRVMGKSANSEKNRYLFMRSNIPPPANAAPVYESAHLQLWKVDNPPKEWVFDHDENWYSYGN